jgi:hypothetical protein
MSIEIKEVSLFGLNELILNGANIEIIDNRIPKDFRNKKIKTFDITRPLMIGGYILKVEDHEDIIRIGGNGNKTYSQSDFGKLLIKIIEEKK